MNGGPRVEPLPRRTLAGRRSRSYHGSFVTSLPGTEVREIVMRLRRVFAIWLAVTVLLCPIVAQEQKPNFTGIWKLDPHRSTVNGQIPDSVTLYIHQHDPDFHLRSTEVQHGKSWAWSVHGRTDGKTLELKSREGIKRTHMYWQGSQLVLEYQNNDKRGETQKVVRYSLSDGGRTLVAHEMDNDHENRLVFTKSG
jgi:hypothetical protein